MEPTSDLAVFLHGNSEIARGLTVLAAAESLTDALAIELITQARIDVNPQRLIRSLHLCDFVVERNSEWQFAVGARRYLSSMLLDSQDLASGTHRLLLDVASASTIEARDDVPRYLQDLTGIAYHKAFLAVDAALADYSTIAMRARSGQQWLASTLAREQQDVGILPQGALEVDFLQGMVRYREGRIRDAERLLRPIADSSQRRIEVAIAAHLVGRLDGRRPGSRRRGEELLRRSVSINEELGNELHVAQVLHTLGQLIGRDHSRLAEAEDVLRRSLAVREPIGDLFGTAQVLHTLGQLIGRDRSRLSEAEELLRRSLTMGEALRNEAHIAQVLHTLGQLVGRDRSRPSEAEKLLRRSLAIEAMGDDQSGMAQVLHTLGQLIGRDRSRLSEAEELLRRSLTMGEALRNESHIAQVLRSLGQLLARDPARRGGRGIAAPKPHDQRSVPQPPRCRDR